MRDRHALPEEPTYHFVHERCTEAFTESRPGLWDCFALSSLEARWLLPVRPQWHQASSGGQTKAATPAPLISHQPLLPMQQVVLAPAIQELADDLAVVASHMENLIAHCAEVLNAVSTSDDWDTRRDVHHLSARLSATSRQLEEAVHTMERLGPCALPPRMQAVV